MSHRPAPLVLRLLLSLLPAPFRRRYAADMAATFLERRASARRDGRLAVLALWWRTAVDVSRVALLERVRSSIRPDGSTRMRGHAVPGPVPARGGVMSGWWDDVRYASRALAGRPAYALFVVLTLAVGIGATTAVFSVVHGVVLRPLPYHESDRLVAVWSRFVPESGFDFEQFPLSGPEYLDYRDTTRTMASVAAYSVSSLTVAREGGEPERVAYAAVTPDTFDLLRVTVPHGRGFTAADGEPDAPLVVILSDRYWRSRYGADPGAVGKTVVVNGRARTIVGVAEPGFGFPGRDLTGYDRSYSSHASTPTMWLPLRIDPANPGDRQSHYLSAIGRLAPGVTLDAAHAELDVMMRNWRQQWPEIHTGHFLFVRPLTEEIVGEVQPVLWTLLGATGFLLLIVCTNVSSVVLARGESRHREMAIRSALGAGRRRLLRLSMVESLVLAALGGLGGVGLAYAGVRALSALENSGVPRADEVTVDAVVLGFAAMAAGLSAVLFGVLPALRGSTPAPQAALRSDDRTATTGAARLRFRRALVAAEVALTVMLVIAAGLMVRSFTALIGVDPGFRAHQVILGTVSLPSIDYPEAAHVESFYDALLARLGAAPGIARASAGSAVPIYNSNGVWDFELEGVSAPAAGAPAWNAAISFVRPGYFDVLGIPVLRGRVFTDADDARRPTVVVINEAMAEKYFPGENPLGRRLRIAGNDSRPWSSIVGVVGNVREESLDEPPRPVYYMASRQALVTAGQSIRSMVLTLRTERSPAIAGQSVRQVLGELDARLPFFRVESYDQTLAQSVARRTFATSLFGVFALLGLILGASGIYGVLTYGVARRTSEIGIRRALGASSAGLIGLVVGQGLVPVAAGLAVGLVASVWASGWIESQLFGVSPKNAATYAAVAAGVLLVAVVACAVPVRRALRVSPIVALRSAD